MQLRDAQRDMRRAYVNGGVGIFVSGLVWVIAGAVTFYVNLLSGMATLFLGGMLIHPLSLFLARRVYHRAKGRTPNPLEMLALQSTPFLFIGLAIAYLVSATYGDWFFAIALLTVGARYLVFQTVYGMHFYLILGAGLIAIAAAALWFGMAPAFVALAGGATELLCSAFILVPAKR
jgi:mannitol-specific phosphotransferase system IIBC component